MIKALIADDHPIMREGLKLFLICNMDIEVEEVASGYEAIKDVRPSERFGYRDFGHLHARDGWSRNPADSQGEFPGVARPHLERLLRRSVRTPRTSKRCKRIFDENVRNRGTR